MSRHMGTYASVESLILQIEGRIWEHLDLIPVSLDSKDVGPEVPCEDSDVNQPTAGLMLATIRLGGRCQSIMC